MKNKIKTFFLALMFFGTFGVTNNSQAAMINAASCSYVDVSAAVAAANYGDTVNVPEGEADWGDNNLVIAKGINLLGAGRDKTIIKATPLAPPSANGYKSLISFSADTETALKDYQFKIDGFYLKANGSYPLYSLLSLTNTTYTNSLTKVIVSNNKFQQLKSSLSSMAIALNPAVFGVVYHNEIIDGSHTWRFLGSMSTGKNVIYWEPGSQYAMYFEDNYIHISEPWNTSLIISGGNGNRYVSRYNTFDLSVNGPNMYTQAYDIHGNQPNNNGGSIGFEAYGELRLGGSGRWFDERSGRIHFFMNKWSDTNGSASYNIWEEYDDDTYTPTSCAGLNYPKTAGGITCLAKPYNSYFWRNFTGMSGTNLVTTANILFDHYNRDTPTLNNPLTMFENKVWWRDNSVVFTGLVDPIGSCGYYNGPSCTKSAIGCGTYDQMQAITTCTEGVGFWMTNQGNCNDISDYVGRNHSKNIEGTLYKCNSSNVWVSSYTPYTYPHPLRRESGDVIAPGVPLGLSIR